MDQHNQGFNFSLRTITKNRLKGAFIQIRQQNPDIQNYLMVVDEKTVKVISAYMKMAELMEFGISAVEKLELSRKQFPQLNAIYFISSTQESIQLLCDDFKNKKQPQYGRVHILLSNEIDNALMQKIAKVDNLLSLISTFKILNLDYICADDQVFNLEMPECLTSAYSEKNMGLQNILKSVSLKLATLLISFNKFYSYEIFYNVNENKISDQVARLTAFRLQELFQCFIKSKSDQYDNIEKQAGKVNVLIIDRSYDPGTPLLHDFFYQPMIYDLLDIKNDVFEIQNEVQGKQVMNKVLLSSKDELFMRYKYKHVGEAFEGIPLDFKEFIKNSTTAKVQQGQMNNLDLQQMSDIVKSLPQYNELLSKYTLHVNLIEKSWSEFQKRNLKEIGELEQSLITGIDGEGKDITPQKILQKVAIQLQNDSLDSYDKLRLVLLTTICLELTEKDRKILTDKLSVEQQKAVLNLIYLGVTPQNSLKKAKSSNRVNQALQKQAKNKLQKATMDLCRNTPLLESLVEQLIESNYKKPQKFENIKLNEDGFVSNKPQQKSLRKKGGQLAKMMQSDDDEDLLNNTQKLVIFVIGGISYAEIRSILSNQKIVGNQITLIGGTQIIKPKDFCEGLLNFKID